MNRYLITLNTNDFLSPNVRASFEHAAKRWGAQYVEIDRPFHGVETNDPFGYKLKMHRLPVPADSRCAWIDGDCVVRADCPNLMSLGEPDQFCGVANFQGDTHDGDPYPSHLGHWRQCAAGAGVRHAYDPARYINGGVLVWTPEHHAKIWQWADAIIERRGLSKPVNPMVEQTMLNLAIAELGIDLCVLPRQFNRLGKDAWEAAEVGVAGAWIHHLANLGPLRGDKRAVLDRIDWRAVPDCAGVTAA